LAGENNSEAVKMSTYQLAVQGMNNGSSIIKLIKALAAEDNYNRVTGAFAYATKRGVLLLLDALKTNMRRWEQIEKRWIVSIDFARTEPAALRSLLSLSNSVVRVPFFEEVMRKKFMPAKCFHLKTLLFDTTRGLKGPVGLLVGSGNLSLSGLSLGYESALAVSWNGGTSRNIEQRNSAILAEVTNIADLFELSTLVTRSMINKYARYRPKTQRKVEDDSGEIISVVNKNSELDFKKAIALRTAKNLWVNVTYVTPNRGKGVPGNQIDLSRGTRVYFGFTAQKVKRNESLGDATIRYDDSTIVCHMRFGNNYMDKLNLPIPGEAGPETYENKTLLFEKQLDGTFKLRIGTRSDVRNWKKFSRRQGTLYGMRSGREYGIFS
jgi:HKD family nuclease